MSNTYSKQENFFQQPSQQQQQGPNPQSKRQFPQASASKHQPYFTPQTPIERAATNFLSPRIAEHKRELYPDYKSQVKIEGSQNDFQSQGISGLRDHPVQEIHHNSQQVSHQKVGLHQFAQIEQDHYETHSNYQMNAQSEYSQNVSSQQAYQVPYQSAVSIGFQSQDVQGGSQGNQGPQTSQYQQMANPLLQSVIDIPSDVKAKHSKRITKLSQYPEVFLSQSQILGWMSKNKDPNQEIKQSQNAIYNPIQQSAQKSKSKGCPDKENDI